MTQTLIQAGPAEAMVSGVKPSLDPLSATLWVDGENVIFRKLGVEKAPGWTDEIALGEDGFELDQALVSGIKTIYIGTGPGRRVYLYTEESGLSALYQFPSVGNIRLETWGTWLLMTNGVDPLRLYKPGTGVAAITDITFTWAKLIYRNNVHMLAANTSNGSDMIEWSAASDVETWTPDRSNSARNITLRDLDGEIKAMVDLGRQIAVYSGDKLTIGRWTGQPFIFSFEQAISGVGALGARSVISVGARNIGMFRHGIYETDGVGFALVDEPDVQKWLQDNVDFTLGENIVGYNNKLLEQAIWHFPAVGGGYLGIPYSYKNRVFGAKLTGRITAAMERVVFEDPVAVIDGVLVFLVGTNAGTAALASYIRTKPLDAGDSTVRKVFDYLRVTGQWTGGKVRLGALEDPNDMAGIVWFVDEAHALEHFFFRDTPYIVVEFSASLINETFRISQFLLGGEVTGTLI